MEAVQGAAGKKHWWAGINPRTVLAVSSCLFVAWLGYLLFLVCMGREPIVLSRPQFLEAEIYVVARVDGSERPAKKIHILEVAWPKTAAALVNTDIIVEELDRCETTDQGWYGPGEYIIPLTKTHLGYILTEIPLSPGFHQDKDTHNYLRIYPASAQARQQLTSLIADYHGDE